MRRTLSLPIIALVALAVGAANAAGAQYKSCQPFRNPFAGTRYAGVDLTHITALHVSCSSARRVARGAERRALGITPTGPIRTFTWHGWRVRGDLRPVHDHYVARKGGRRVSWRF
jgi:hypothetical protein